MSEHYETHCSCGEFIAGCKCLNLNKIKTVVQDGCPACKARLNPNAKRLKRFACSAELINTFFQTGSVLRACTVSAGLPKDARLECVWSADKNTWWFTFSSSEFEEVPIGKDIPTGEITIQSA